MRHVLASVHGETKDEPRHIYKTRVGVPDGLERNYRYDSIDDLPEPLRSEVELGPITNVNAIYLQEDDQPAWNRCPECEWPHLLHGILVEEAIVQDGEHPTEYYHDPVDWVALKYLKCSAPCGWRHDYDADASQAHMDDVPKMMSRLHFLAEKERAHAP